MPDDTLPTRQALAARLYAQGLAPPGCEEVAVDGTAGYLYRLRGAPWHPWHDIADCWHLVEQFELTIERFIALHDASGRLRRPASWVVDGECGEGLIGVRVVTFAEVPTAICQAALKIQAWRKG